MSHTTDEEDDQGLGGDHLPHASQYPKVSFGKRAVNVRELLMIDPENLIIDYQTIHHWIAVTATKVANYTVMISQKKRELARAEARVSRVGRNTEKKLTEAAIKIHVTLDPGISEIQDKIATLEANKGVFAILLDALENKMAMVMNLGAEKRTNHKKRSD